MKNANNFQIAKVQSQYIACKSAASKKSVRIPNKRRREYLLRE